MLAKLVILEINFIENPFQGIISGCTSRNQALKLIFSVNCHLATVDNLDHILNRFWEIEHNISSPQISKEEQSCEEIF